MTFHFSRKGFVDALFRELESHRVVLVTAPRGGGKTHLLRRLYQERQDRPRHGTVALAQIEPLACSPEVLDTELSRLLAPVLSESGTGPHPPSFDALLGSLRSRREGSLLLLDDVTEIRTLSYYPTVTEPLEKFLQALVHSRETCLLTSRFSYWMRRHFPDLTVLGIPRLLAGELEEAGASEPELIAAASGGIAMHAARLAETMSDGTPLVEALVLELSSGGRVEAECRATLAELLHRARGYGACKTVLRALAEEEGLKLTEVARRLDRTAGSTRDYLRWLEEVDLIAAREKRFSYVDPLLRLWMRLHGRGTVPETQEVRDEVEAYVSTFVLQETSSDESAPAVDYTLPPLPSEDFVEID